MPPPDGSAYHYQEHGFNDIADDKEVREALSQIRPFGPLSFSSSRLEMEYDQYRSPGTLVPPFWVAALVLQTYAFFETSLPAGNQMEELLHVSRLTLMSFGMMLVLVDLAVIVLELSCRLLPKPGEPQEGTQPHKPQAQLSDAVRDKADVGTSQAEEARGFGSYQVLQNSIRVAHFLLLFATNIVNAIEVWTCYATPGVSSAWPAACRIRAQITLTSQVAWSHLLRLPLHWEAVRLLTVSLFHSVFAFSPSNTQPSEFRSLILIVQWVIGAAYFVVLWDSERESRVRFLAKKYLGCLERRAEVSRRALSRILSGLCEPSRLELFLSGGRVRDESDNCAVLITRIYDYVRWRHGSTVRLALDCLDVWITEIESLRERHPGVSLIEIAGDTIITAANLSPNSIDSHDPSEMMLFAFGLLSCTRIMLSREEVRLGTRSEFLTQLGSLDVRLGLGFGPCQNEVLKGVGTFNVLHGQAFDDAKIALARSIPQTLDATQAIISECRAVKVSYCRTEVEGVVRVKGIRRTPIWVEVPRFAHREIRNPPESFERALEGEVNRIQSVGESPKTNATRLAVALPPGSIIISSASNDREPHKSSDEVHSVALGVRSNSMPIVPSSLQGEVHAEGIPTPSVGGGTEEGRLGAEAEVAGDSNRPSKTIEQCREHFFSEVDQLASSISEQRTVSSPSFRTPTITISERSPSPDNAFAQRLHNYCKATAVLFHPIFEDDYCHWLNERLERRRSFTTLLWTSLYIAFLVPYVAQEAVTPISAGLVSTLAAVLVLYQFRACTGTNAVDPSPSSRSWLRRFSLACSSARYQTAALGALQYTLTVAAAQTSKRVFIFSFANWFPNLIWSFAFCTFSADGIPLILSLAFALLGQFLLFGFRGFKNQGVATILIAIPTPFILLIGKANILRREFEVVKNQRRRQQRSEHLRKIHEEVLNRILPHYIVTHAANLDDLGARGPISDHLCDVAMLLCRLPVMDSIDEQGALLAVLQDQIEVLNEISLISTDGDTATVAGPLVRPTKPNSSSFRRGSTLSVSALPSTTHRSFQRLMIESVANEAAHSLLLLFARLLRHCTHSSERGGISKHRRRGHGLSAVLHRGDGVAVVFRRRRPVFGLEGATAEQARTVLQQLEPGTTYMTKTFADLSTVRLTEYPALYGLSVGTKSEGNSEKRRGGAISTTSPSSTSSFSPVNLRIRGIGYVTVVSIQLSESMPQ